MKEYKISSFADFMQALRENPEWLEELRRMILTQELLELPKRFEDFRHGVEERLGAIEKGLGEVKKKLDVVEKKLDKDVCSLKGMWLEVEVKKHVHSFFSEYLSNVKLVGQKRINKALSLAMEKGTISKEEREDVFRLDLVIEGTLLSTKEPVLVAVEISYTIAENDVQRAVKRAEILKKAMDRKVLPAVVGYRISEGTEKLITKKGMLEGFGFRVSLRSLEVFVFEPKELFYNSVVVDLGTTGLNPAKSQIFQIGAIKPTQKGIIVFNRYAYLEESPAFPIKRIEFPSV